MHLTRSPQRNILKVSSFWEASEKERKKERNQKPNESGKNGFPLRERAWHQAIKNCTKSGQAISRSNKYFVEKSN